LLSRQGFKLKTFIKAFFIKFNSFKKGFFLKKEFLKYKHVKRLFALNFKKMYFNSIILIKTLLKFYENDFLPFFRSLNVRSQPNYAFNLFGERK
jgi:hypothetical protein